MANDLADFLEALPFPALLITAEGAITYANMPGQTLGAKLSAATYSVAFNAAIHQAATQDKQTHLGAELLPPGIGAWRGAWISPLHGQALLIAEAANDTHDYTQLSSTMAAMLAHEIRNPLLSIKGAAQLLAGSASDDDKPLATLIGNEVARIDQLIATLDPLAPAPREQQPLNVHELVEHAVLAVQAAHPIGISFTKQYDPSLPEILGNRDALIQALVNLIKNASEAVEMVGMPEITLATRYDMAGNHRNTAGQKVPIAISVTDNGRGVPPAFVPHLFAPFATTKTSGKGLGLAVVARIAEEYGGLVLHERPEHGGARFTLYLPIAASPATPA